MIETPGWDTGSSFGQQSGMVQFLAEKLGASIKYVKEGEDTVSVVILPDGSCQRFNVYGWRIN